VVSVEVLQLAFPDPISRLPQAAGSDRLDDEAKREGAKAAPTRPRRAKSNRVAATNPIVAVARPHVEVAGGPAGARSKQEAAQPVEPGRSATSGTAKAVTDATKAVEEATMAVTEAANALAEVTRAVATESSTSAGSPVEAVTAIGTLLGAATGKPPARAATRVAAEATKAVTAATKAVTEATHALTEATKLVAAATPEAIVSAKPRRAATPRAVLNLRAATTAPELARPQAAAERQALAAKPGTPPKPSPATRAPRSAPKPLLAAKALEMVPGPLPVGPKSPVGQAKVRPPARSTTRPIPERGVEAAPAKPSAAARLRAAIAKIRATAERQAAGAPSLSPAASEPISQKQRATPRATAKLPAASKPTALAVTAAAAVGTLSVTTMSSTRTGTAIKRRSRATARASLAAARVAVSPVVVKTRPEKEGPWSQAELNAQRAGRAILEAALVRSEAFGAAGEAASPALAHRFRSVWPLSRLQLAHALPAGATTFPAGPPILSGRLRLFEPPSWSRFKGTWRARTMAALRSHESGWSLASLVVVDLTLTAIIVSLQSTTLHLDSYGLMSSLGPIYFLGLLVLVAAGAVALMDHRLGPWLLLVYAFVFGFLVWLTPLVLEGTPHFRSAYQNLGYVDPILQGYGLVPGYFLYHNWPVFPLLMAGLIDIARVPSLTLLAWYPIAMVLLYAAIVVVFVAILGRRFQPRMSLVLGGAVAAWSYFLFNWTQQEYFSPQALAYLVFLILLCVLAWSSVERDGVLTPRLTFGVLGLFALIVATHVLTSIVFMSVLFLLLFTRHIRRPTILITCGLIFIVWQVTVAAPFFVFYSQQLLSSVLGATNFLGANLEGRVRGDAGHMFITELRVLASGLPYALAGLAVLLAIVANPEWRSAVRRLRLPNLPRAVSFPLAAIVGTGLIAPVSAYGGEMLIRVLFFSLPALCALIAFGVQENWFRALVLATLVVMAPIHLLTQYGNEQLDYVSPGEIAGMDYLTSLAPANVFGAFPAGSTYNTIRLDARNAFLFAGEPTSLADYADPWLHHQWVHTDWPLYVAVSRGDDAAMALFTNRPDFISEVRSFLDHDANYSRIYANQDMAIYLWKPSAGGNLTPSDSMVSGAYAEKKASAPLPLLLLCALSVLLAVAVEICASLSGRAKAQAYAARMMIPTAGLSLVVIAVSGYHIAGLIGLIP
jgi:hypothetical protein